MSPSYEELKTSDNAHQMHGFGHPAFQNAPQGLVVFESGKNATLTDVQGNKYIDAMGGITVAHLGHGREDMAKIAFEQMRKLEVSSNQRNMTNPNAIQVCQKLSDLAKKEFPGHMDGARVYLTAGGAEGIEAAYHLALRYFSKSGPLGSSVGGGYKKQKVLSFRNCYHGATFIAQSLKPEFSDYGYQRWTEGQEDKFPKMFHRISPPHGKFFPSEDVKEGENVGQAAARVLEETIQREGEDTFAAFIFEPVQGDGGAVDMHPDFFPLARKICDKYRILMIADEIMAFAKTGHWFGMSKYGVAPDIMVVSKGLTCGYLPMGAVIYTNAIWKQTFANTTTKMMASDVWQHDYTWSGHPVCAAIALKAMDIIETENLIPKAAERGAKFLAVLKEKLSGLHVVSDIRGSGIMIGIDLISNIATDIEQKMLLEYKVCLRASTNKHCILMTPPYSITDEQIETVANDLYEVLNSWATKAESAVSMSRDS